MSFSNIEEQLIIKGDKDVLVKPANLESRQEYALQQEEWPNAEEWVQHAEVLKVKLDECNALMQQRQDAECRSIMQKHMLDAGFREIVQDFKQEANLESQQEYAIQQEEFSDAMLNQKIQVSFEEARALSKQMLHAMMKQVLDPRYIKGYIKASRNRIQELEQKNDSESTQDCLQLRKYLHVRLEEADNRAKQDAREADVEMLIEAKVSEEKAMVDAACFADDFLSKVDALHQGRLTKTMLQQINDLPEGWQADLGMLNEAKISEEKAMVDAACFTYDLLSGQAHTLQQEILPKTILQQMNGLQIS